MTLKRLTGFKSANLATEDAKTKMPRRRCQDEDAKTKMPRRRCQDEDANACKGRGLKMRAIGIKILFLFHVLLFYRNESRAADRVETKNSAQISPALTGDSAEIAKPSANSALNPHAGLTSSATVTIASSYIYRGISQSSGRPVVQGSLDLSHASGFGLGVFGSNIDLGGPGEPSSAELDAYLDFNSDLQSFKYGFMLNSTNFIDRPTYNSFELSGYLSFQFLKLDVSYMPRYFGGDSSSLYSRLTGTLPMTSKDALLLACGYSAFDHVTTVGFHNYFDFKAGINHTVDQWGAEIDWTSTNRKNLEGGGMKDQAVSFSLTRIFD